MTYVDGFDATSLRVRYCDDTNSGDAEEIEGGRAYDCPGSEFTGLKPSSNDLYAGQQDLRRTRAKCH